MLVRLTLRLCALIWALPAVAGTTWDGGGANASWGTANNWSANVLPLFNGTETITLGTAFTSGAAMTLDGNRYINDLTINTITGFTLATGTGGTLNLRSGNITRQDVVGSTEAVQIISAGMVLGDPAGVAAYTGAWNIAGSNSLNITGNIAEAGGSRSINMTGAGTVILSGTNTFSGGLTMSAGTVSISSNANLGAASGGLTFNGGTLQVTGNVIGTRAITMTGAGTFDVALGSTLEQSGVVSGNGILSLTSFGTLILSGSGSNGTGSTNIGGILSLRGTVALGTGNVAFTTGVLELGNGNFTRALGAGAGQVNMSTATNGAGFAAYGADRIVNLGGAGAIVTWGSGSFLATGQVFYLGSLTADHTLDFQNGINLNGAARSIQVLRGVGSVPEAKISGAISGAGASNLSVDAAPGFSGGRIILSNGGNSYAGTTTINAGDLLLDANATGTAGNTVLGSGASDILIGNTTGAYDAGLETNSAVTVSRNLRAQSGNTGVITLGGNSASTSTFSGSLFLGTNSGLGKGVTLTSAAGGTTTFSGVIQDPAAVSGAGLLRIGGLGTIVLSGANTYAGGTSIDSGTLSISLSTNLGANAGGVTINAGTLQITSGFSTNRVFTLADVASTFQVDPAQTLTITSVIGGTGTLNKNGTGTLTLNGANTYSSGSIINSGTVIVTSNGNLGAAAGAVTINAATLDIAGAFTSTRNFTLGTATSTVQVDPTFTFTANGIFSGPGTLNKTGTGTLVLGGLNTYTGATNVNAGTLREGTANAIPDSSAVTVASGATYDLNSFSETIGSIAGGGTVTSGAAGALTLTAGGDNTSTLFSGVLQNGSGTVSFTKSGTGTLTLSGANTYSGLTTVSNGILAIQNTSALGTTAGATAVNSGATLELLSGIAVAAEPLTLNGVGVSGFGALRNLSGNNSFAGAITLGSASTIYSDAGTLTFSGGIANGGFTTTFGGAGNISETNPISGAGALVKNDGGILTLGGANTYSGGTTINGGTTIITSTGNLGNTLGAATINAATLEVAATFTSPRNFTLGSAASTVQVDPTFTFTATGIFSGTGTLNKTGAGTMVLSGLNLFSGGTNVIGGTLQLSAVDRLLTTAGLTISGGTFDLQTFGQTTAAVTLSSGTISGTGAGTLTALSYTLQSGTVSAILAGLGTINKNTAGTVTLSGSNTFTGSTTISAGLLQVNTNNALGTTASGTTVANGAALKLNNVNYSTAEPLTLNGSGISNGGALMNSGTSTFAGPINAATNATINAGGGTLTLTGGISKNGTTLTIAGGGTVNVITNGITGSAANSDLIVDGTTVVLSAANSYNGPTTIQNSGTLKLGNSNVLPTTPQTALTINTSSTFDLASYSDGVASLTGDSTATVKNSVVGGTSTLTVNPGSGSSTFAGIITGTNAGAQGNVALQKNGAGALVLTGANTFSGATTVNAGTLTAAAASGSALASTSSVTVNSGGTLALGQSNQINDTATMTLVGGIFAKGNFSEGSASTAGMGTLTLAASGSQIDFGSGTVGVLTFASFDPGAYALSITNWTGTANTVGGLSTDRLIFASDQSANLSSFVFAGYAPGAVEFDLGNGYFEVTPFSVVPETSTWLAGAFTLGMLGAQIALRRRRAKASRTP
jgi:fibronectin-binding autotransporter adhesin